MYRPAILQLPLSDEVLASESTDILKANGFVLEFNETASPTQRCRLLKMPTSQNVTFNIQDLEELLHLIKERPGDTMIRPSKVRKMFASRACRKSIMIGDSLNMSQMQRVRNSVD